MQQRSDSELDAYVAGKAAVLQRECVPGLSRERLLIVRERLLEDLKSENPGIRLSAKARLAVVDDELVAREEAAAS